MDRYVGVCDVIITYHLPSGRSVVDRIRGVRHYYTNGEAASFEYKGKQISCPRDNALDIPAESDSHVGDGDRTDGLPITWQRPRKPR